MSIQGPVGPGRLAGVVGAAQCEGWPDAVRADCSDPSQSTDGASTRLGSFEAGAMHHFDLGPGESLLRDLEHVGEPALLLVTAECCIDARPSDDAGALPVGRRR